MKKCLLGIAMLLTASFSFAQGYVVTPSPVTMGLNSQQELTIGISASEEYIEKLMTGFVAIELPEGMEFVKNYGRQKRDYFEVIAKSSFEDNKADVNVTIPEDHKNVMLIAYTCYYYDDETKETYGFPYEDGEEVLKITVRTTDKIPSGNAVITFGDKPFLTGDPGEDPRMMFTTVDEQPIFPEEGTIVPVNISLPVSVGGSGYATLCYPMPLDFTGSNMKASVATEITSDGFVQREYVTAIPAKTPVIIEAAQGDYTVKTTPEAETTAPAVNLLSGTPDGTYTATNKTFALASKNEGVGFYRCNAGVVIPQYRAYIESESSADESFLFEETTGISSVEAEAGNTDAYTISGVKVKNPTQKGIYIINGKKIVK
jgi:hypothetical protein